MMNIDLKDDETFNCMERIEQKYVQEDEQESYRYPHPSTNTPIILLLTTILLTSCASILTCLSLMNNHWEYIRWDVGAVQDYEIEHKKPLNGPPYVYMETLLDKAVIKITINDFIHKNEPGNVALLNIPNNATIITIYLVPMKGGIWTMCVQLTDQQLDLLREINFPVDTCIHYLSSEQFKDEEHLTSTWNYRMKNVSISSALVSLILLGSAAVVGTFGVIKHQLSAILITGVMYLLAGTFALIIVLILHVKILDYRKNTQTYENSGILNTTVSYIVDDGVIQHTANSINTNPNISTYWMKYTKRGMRKYNFGWSYDVGILGVLISMITSIMWIVMAKVLRYTTIGISV